jgi:hypothetical protein
MCVHSSHVCALTRAGNLEPGQAVQTKLEYVTELQMEHVKGSASASGNTVVEPDVRSSLLTATTYRFVLPISHVAPVGQLDQEVLTVSAAMPEGIRSVSSPSHALSSLSINGAWKDSTSVIHQILTFRS